MKKTILLPALIVLFISCSKSEKKSVVHIVDPGTVSYLALGDSYTIGTGVKADNNWPNQLSDSLEVHGFNIDTTAIIATNGWTTGDLLNGIEKQAPDSSYNLVSLLIGVNNQYRGYDLDIYKKEFRLLLDQAVSFTGNDPSNVFVVSIPNYGVTPFGQSGEKQITHEIEQYNDIARQISTEYEILFINITPISEIAAEDSTLLAPDELHPSGKMYALWIKEMLPKVKEILTR